MGSRGQCLIYFKRASTHLVSDSRNQLGSVLGTQSKKAFDIFHVFDGDRRVQIALNELTLASGFL